MSCYRICRCCFTPPQNLVELPAPPSRKTTPIALSRRLTPPPPLQQTFVQGMSSELALRYIQPQKKPSPSKHQPVLSAIEEGPKLFDSPQGGAASPELMDFHVSPSLPRTYSISSGSTPTPESVIRFDASAKKTFSKLKSAVVCFNKTTFQITFANRNAVLLFMSKEGVLDPIGKNIKIFFPNLDLSKPLEPGKTYNTDACNGNTVFPVDFSLTSGLDPAQSQKISNIWIQTIHPSGSNIQSHLDEHDARNALLGIQGQLMLLNEEEGPTIRKTMLKGVSSASDQALSIFEGNLNKLKKTRALGLEPVTLQEFFNYANDQLKVRALKHQFGFEIDSSVPSFLELPPKTTLVRVLDNLVGNAVKFTKEGKKITIRMSKDPGDFVLFQVIDEGRGMTPDQAATLFKPFVQLNPNDKGTGLGLVSCKQLVDEMNPGNSNNIGITSELGKGSIFWFRVPFKLPPEEKKERKIEEPLAVSKVALSDLEKEALRGLHILVVDDSSINQKILKRQLEKLGCSNVSCVGDGELLVEGYKKAYESKPFDIIFTDLNMPKMNGQDATKVVRQNETQKHRAVIIGCSAATNDNINKACLSAGMDEVLVKPITNETLLRLVLPVARKKSAKLD